jgi:transcription initiation factor TFIIE subunit beta
VNEAQRTAQYVSVYDIYTPEELLKFLRAQKSFQGVPVRALKDGWSGCLDAIEQLEKSGKLLVLRTKKENAPRLIWANVGGPVGGIDDKFLDLWKHTKVPSASELPAALERARLKPTSVDPATVKHQSSNKKGEEKKQKKPRRSKITNTHLGRGILKDYGI